MRVSIKTFLGTGEVYTEFHWGNLRERDHLEDRGVDGRKGGSLEVQWVVDWIDLARDRDRWRAVVNAVINLRVPKKVRKFLAS
jgi:hypothetical protein